MRDVDELLRALKPVPEAPRVAPSEPRRWPRLVVVGAVAAGLGLLLLAAPRDLPRARGASGPVAVDLRMTVERAGQAVRVSPGATVGIGERVFFRLAGSARGTAWVWVEGPGGTVPVGEVEVDPVPRDLATAAGLTAWRFDAPGRYVFRASGEGPGACHGCPSIVLEAR